jgi:Cu2+-exporting ATPase
MTLRGRMAHAVPGRLRLRYPPAWLAREGQALAADLRRLPGVRAVETRSLTGSVVVEYDPRRTPEPDVLAVMARAPAAARRDRVRPRGRPASSRGLAARLPGLRLAGASVAFGAAWLPFPSPVLAGLLAVSALPVARRAGRALVLERRLSVDVLDALALLILGWRAYYRPAGLLVWLLAVGDYVLHRTVVRMRRSLDALLTGADHPVARVHDGGRTTVPAGALRAGDAIVVGTGERLPADGTVLAGEALVDQQRVTGEGLPVERVEGDRVFASTVVETGEITVRIDRLGAETSVGRIIETIAAAEGEKPELMLFAENVADRLVLRTVGYAAAAALVTRSLDAGVAILVADYGTPVRVALPAAALAARLAASRHGILVKGPSVLERLARVDTVVFDKTGTLTLGAPRVTRVRSYGTERTEDDIVRLAALAERGFRHPVADAVARLATERGLTVAGAATIELRGGLGVAVRAEGARVLVGSRRFMAGRGVALDPARADEDDGHRAGGSSTFVAVDGRLAGLLVLQDELRPDARAAVAALRARRMRNVIMVSGDHPEPTRVIAESLGVRHYHADLLPRDKAELIHSLRGEGRVVAMVGDGVNDALALREADVGIAVPGGPDVVAEAASVVLLEGGLDRVVLALDLSRDAITRFRRAVAVAVGANVAVVGLASLGLAGPFTAILLSNGATVTAALAALAPARPAAPIEAGRS